MKGWRSDIFSNVIKSAKHSFAGGGVLALVVALFIAGILSSAVPAAAQVRDSNICWSVEEYLEENPWQAPVMNRFSSLVRAAAVPLTFEQDRPLEIWILYPGLQESDYWRRSVDAFKGRMDEIGISYNILTHFTRPGEDELKTQSRIIELALQEQPDFLVFTLDAMRHRGLIGRVVG